MRRCIAWRVIFERVFAPIFLTFFSALVRLWIELTDWPTYSESNSLTNLIWPTFRPMMSLWPFEDDKSLFLNFWQVHDLINTWIGTLHLHGAYLLIQTTPETSSPLVVCEKIESEKSLKHYIMVVYYKPSFWIQFYYYRLYQLNLARHLVFYRFLGTCCCIFVLHILMPADLQW